MSRKLFQSIMLQEFERVGKICGPCTRIYEIREQTHMGCGLMLGPALSDVIDIAIIHALSLQAP
jgi:hypothetical protein